MKLPHQITTLFATAILTMLSASPALAVVEGQLCGCVGGPTGTTHVPGNWTVLNRLTEPDEKILKECGLLANYDNPCNGSTPQPKSCVLNGSTAYVWTWEVGGNLGNEFWGVSGEKGSKYDMVCETALTCEVNNWCQACHVVWVATFEKETVKVKCVPNINAVNTTCPSISGTKSTYQSSTVRNGSLPDLSNCKVNCPG